MPSPFPGMDPYLEGSYWSPLHHSLAEEILRQLAPRLRPRYVALPEERFVVEIQDTRSNIYPDGGVTSSEVAEPGADARRAPLKLATIVPSPVPLVTVEIRSTDERRLVTAIEILSPTNKRGDGRREYLSKRQKVLRSSAHLVEIDLLRRGTRVPMERDLPAAPYFVFLGRAHDRPMVDVWPVALDEPLPTIPIPLLDGEPEILLDLQEALDHIYDLRGFDLLIDYSRPPEVALDPAEAEQARRILDRAALPQSA